ncbi:MAG: DUF2961 domain-containing protein [Phycisphaeraceae bacterium]|nr:DUF2961 domain-containing protein [Phycisphaeraceae bacterium]
MSTPPAPTAFYQHAPHLQTRWASPENFTAAKGQAGQAHDGRKGSACVFIHAHQSLVLADVTCPTGSHGLVHRIWATLQNRSPAGLRGLRLDIYWDGCAKPAVSVPFGDFFGHTLGQMSRFESELFAAPEGRSFNCYIPMPFRTGMKVVVTNELDQDHGWIYFDVDFTLGHQHPAEVLYFHSHFRRENPTRLGEDFEILPLVRGKGRFLGSHMGARADVDKYLDIWWGEGEVKVFLDGDKPFPTLCGTGTEDYIGTGWGQEFYAGRYQGSHIADKANMQYGFYRLHVPDPIYFHQDIRVTIQQMGWAMADKLRAVQAKGVDLRRGNAKLTDEQIDRGSLFERADDWCVCAYFYLDKPANDLPPLLPLAARLADLIDPKKPQKRLDV